MNVEKRVRTVEEKAVKRLCQELLGEKGLFCDRSEEEQDFFAVHGFFPEVANVGGRTARSFVVYGLKTSIILEPVKPYEMSGEDKSR